MSEDIQMLLDRVAALFENMESMQQTNQALVKSLQAAPVITNMELRPIETAPRNKEVILFLYDESFVDPVVLNSICCDREEQGWIWLDWHERLPPTHWMPMPPSPETT